MSINKAEILNKICYTVLVYGRINKKLNTKYSEVEIEKKLLGILLKTEDKHFQIIGKNFYVTNREENIKITINRNTYRIITVDKIEKINFTRD